MEKDKEADPNEVGGSGAGAGSRWWGKPSEGLRSRGGGAVFLLRVFLVLVTIWALWSFLPAPTVEGAALSDQQIQDLIVFLKENNPNFSNFTYDQLKQWFEAQTPDDIRWEEYPRLYPFCVTANQLKDSARTKKTDHLHHFIEIFTDIERINEKFYNFDVRKHSAHPIYGNTKWIKKITLSRINTPELDMVNLRQWLHIKVETVEPMQALYMQSIVGPMGLPFGEFFLDFPCAEEVDTQNMNVQGQLSYCSYRPRTTIQHPSAFVAYNETGTTVFHTHFFWADITCMEMPYLQFLMLVVKNFHYNSSFEGKPKLGLNYMPLLSPIYLNTDFDSKSGAPFPYYPEWRDKMYCSLTNETFDDKYNSLYNDPINIKYPSEKDGADANYDVIDWQIMNDTFRIQANEVYDACITGTTRYPELKDDDRLECPPGPFRCDSTYGTMSRDDLKIHRGELVKFESSISNCTPCGVPECTDIGFPEHKCDAAPDDLLKEINESNALNTVEAIVASKTHGVQAVLAFLVLVPLANFVARFYKELCGGFLCGNGPWIFIHIGAHILSVFLMWISLGPVLPRLAEIKRQAKLCKTLYRKGPEYRRCLRENSFLNPHVITAAITFMIQHFLLFLGFWRSGNVKIRNIQIILHSHFGYFCWLLGAISVILVGWQIFERHDKECRALLALSIMFFLTPFAFIGAEYTNILFFVRGFAGVGLDCLTDQKVGIIPPRRQWPVLETIKLEGRSPFWLPKWILLGAFTAILLLFWFLVLGDSLAVMIGSSDNLVSQKTSGVSGLFGGSGDCSNIKDVAKAEADIKSNVQLKSTSTPQP